MISFLRSIEPLLWQLVGWLVFAFGVSVALRWSERQRKRRTRYPQTPYC